MSPTTKKRRVSKPPLTMTTANTSSRLGASPGLGTAGAGSGSGSGSAASGANSITEASDSEDLAANEEEEEGLDGASLRKETGATPALE